MKVTRRVWAYWTAAAAGSFGVFEIWANADKAPGTPTLSQVVWSLPWVVVILIAIFLIWLLVHFVSGRMRRR